MKTLEQIIRRNDYKVMNDILNKIANALKAKIEIK